MIVLMLMMLCLMRRVSMLNKFEESRWKVNSDGDLIEVTD